MRSRYDNQKELQKILEANIGKRMEAKQILKLLGYSPNTFVMDIRPRFKGWIKQLWNGNPELYEIQRGKDL